MNFMQNILITILLVFNTLGLSACTQKDSPDCSIPMYNVWKNLQTTAANGRGNKARKQAKNYAICFDQDPSYWLMRASLVPSSFGDYSHLKKDAGQAIAYIDHAIALDPNNGHNKQAKTGALVVLEKYKQAAKIYESVLTKVMKNPKNDGNLELERSGVFEAASPYIQSMDHLHKMDRARSKLTPFIADICASYPDYTAHYAQTIVWLDKKLNNAKPKGLIDACNDFRKYTLIKR